MLSTNSKRAKVQHLHVQIACMSYYSAAPPNGARPVINSIFGRLCRKTYSGGREDTRSGTEERCSHKWFHTILPLIAPTLMHEYICDLPQEFDAKGESTLTTRLACRRSRICAY